MGIVRRDTFGAILTFDGGGDAGLLIVAPAPVVTQNRWCRWAPSPHPGVAGADEFERLALATMRLGYALGMADGWAGRDRDVIGRGWIERTLPRLLEPPGIVVTAVVHLGPMSEAEIAGDRVILWEQCRDARADADALHRKALRQLEEALDEMGGVAMHDFDEYMDGGGDADEALSGTEVLGTAQPAARQPRGNVA